MERLTRAPRLRSCNFVSAHVVSLGTSWSTAKRELLFGRIRRRSPCFNVWILNLYVSSLYKRLSVVVTYAWGLRLMSVMMENRSAFFSLLLLSLALVQLAVCQNSPDCSALQVPFSGAPFSGELSRCTIVHRENSRRVHACMRWLTIKTFRRANIKHQRVDACVLQRIPPCSKSVVVQACSVKLYLRHVSIRLKTKDVSKEPSPCWLHKPNYFCTCEESCFQQSSEFMYDLLLNVIETVPYCLCHI